MSALRSELKTVLRIQVNTLPSLGKESEAACGWSVPGMFFRDNGNTVLFCGFHQKEWKSTRSGESVKCSYIAKGRRMDIYRPGWYHISSISIDSVLV